MSGVSALTVPVAWRGRYTRLAQGVWERVWSIPGVGERLAAAERAALPARPCCVLFLCKGNICRSAYAEQAARRLAQGRPGWVFRSAGLDARPGSPSPEAAVRLAAENGIDLAGHRSRAVDSGDIRAAEAIVVMEPHQKGEARRTGLLGAVALLGAFGPRPVPVLHDPYGRGDADYRGCFARIEEALAALMARADAHRLPAAKALSRPERSLP